MPLLKQGQPAEDPFVALDDPETPPPNDPETAILVPLARWTAERDSLLGRSGPLGVRMEPADDPEDLAGDLDRLSLIAVAFPKFNDGRGYSTARILRERLGFTGELRAVGEILRDQLLFLDRSGFDAFEIDRPDAVDAWVKAHAEITVFYQPTGDDRPVAFHERLRRRKAAAE
ncbi:MAG: DUF934 domain-containing protein [Azospirillaceae bacterium]